MSLDSSVDMKQINMIIYENEYIKYNLFDNKIYNFCFQSKLYYGAEIVH